MLLDITEYEYQKDEQDVDVSVDQRFSTAV